MSVIINGTTGITTAAAAAPAFNAYASAGTSLSANTNTKVLFATSLFDTNSNYSTSTSKFTPTIAGYYSVTARVRADIAANTVLNTSIYKNGNAVAEGSFISVLNSQQSSIANGLIYMNGSTDYLEVYIYSGAAGSSFTGQSSTYFCGFLARSA